MKRCASSRQVVEAAIHCEKRRVFHRDIKTENIILDLADDEFVKLADFGLATLMRDGPYRRFMGKKDVSRLTPVHDRQPGRTSHLSSLRHFRTLEKRRDATEQSGSREQETGTEWPVVASRLVLPCPVSYRRVSYLSFPSHFVSSRLVSSPLTSSSRLVACEP